MKDRRGDYGYFISELKEGIKVSDYMLRLMRLDPAKLVYLF